MEDTTNATDNDDVEAALDEILTARLAVLRQEEADDEGDDDGDTYGDGLAEVIPVRRPGEFHCRSCFLVKSASQRADATGALCSDCA